MNKVSMLVKVSYIVSSITSWNYNRKLFVQSKIV